MSSDQQRMPHPSRLRPPPGETIAEFRRRCMWLVLWFCVANWLAAVASILATSALTPLRAFSLVGSTVAATLIVRAIRRSREWRRPRADRRWAHGHTWDV